MKKFLFKFISICLTALFSTLVFAQESECDKLYNEDFVPNYRSRELQKLKLAIDSGKQFVEKCSNEEAYKEPIEFVKKQLPRMERNYKFSLAVNTFDDAVKDAKNPKPDAAFASGKEILTLEPNFPQALDIMLTLASVGLDQALSGNKKYIEETLRYAKEAVQKLEANAPSKDYGLWSYVYKTKEFPDGKSNALAWMNYTIGYIMFYHQGLKKEAVPYLFRALQYNSNVKKRPEIYEAIGDFYKEEYNRLDDERTETAKKIQEETNEEVKKQLFEKAKEILALQKGYAERMIDAYARARENAGNDQRYKESLYETIKILYSVRFDGKKEGVDQYITSLISKPMPDPTSPVMPIVEPASTTSGELNPPVSTTTNGAIAEEKVVENNPPTKQQKATKAFSKRKKRT
ncbi:MAG: hypothetical protein N2Z23_10325 [Pyrinomonadaceae bacterium]|nr:hypothetical protein [Pyrinomonadaceae bacterium]MCX7640820.1 hypothetical protein [Pyrinomonadaceae bacterium]MDW8303415.1 hypothetical protein [Acidobacteriota bacterium]